VTKPLAKNRGGVLPGRGGDMGEKWGKKKKKTPVIGFSKPWPWKRYGDIFPKHYLFHLSIALSGGRSRSKENGRTPA